QSLVLPMSRSCLLFSFSPYSYAPHPDLHSFPTRRSSDLFFQPFVVAGEFADRSLGSRRRSVFLRRRQLGHHLGIADVGTLAHVRDRKSTRLNSSHVKISYAVFCLKKKKKK